LPAAFEEGFRRIAAHSANNPATHGMGTTLTATVLGADGSLQVGHIGDSRLYQLRSGALRQLTRDHTWVQAEVDAGRLAESSARTHPLSHLLTRVLAADSPLDADYFDLGVAPGDLYLLCTDGLHNHVYGRSLHKNLQAGGTPSEVVDRLITMANRRGGRDNITAVVLRIR
jgi:protein phosphatase